MIKKLNKLDTWDRVYYTVSTILLLIVALLSFVDPINIKQYIVNCITINLVVFTVATLSKPKTTKQ